MVFSESDFRSDTSVGSKLTREIFSPFSGHDGPQDVQDGQVEEGLDVDGRRVLLEEEFNHSIGFLQQNRLEGLLPEAEVLQGLEGEPAVGLPRIAVVENQAWVDHNVVIKSWKFIFRL